MTAANASGINDGAAAVIVMSARLAEERGLESFGTVESHASDIDAIELNEAFAAQSLAGHANFGA